MRAEREFSTLEDTAALILRHWVLFVSILIVSVGASTSLAFGLDRIYRAETLLVPADQPGGQEGMSMLGGLGGLGGLGSLAELAGLSFMPQDDTYEYMAILTSYSFLTSFV